jgi:predicted amidohydrolase YtcJ
MSHLYTNFRWWRDGAPCNLQISAQGKVTYRGSEEPLADDVTDLGGAWLMPAFVDCHCHILSTGLDLHKLNLSACDSREQILELLRERSEQTPEWAWVLAVQYDQTRLEDGRHITADEIESATLGRPAILRHASGHACVANRTAIGLADARDVEGGEIVRDRHGEPTGVLLENAMRIVYQLLPPPTREEMADAIFAASEKLNAMGIVSAADMGATHNLEDQFWAYQNAIERGARLRIRLYPNWSQVFKGGPQLPEPTDNLRVAGIKLYADGAIGAGTAAVSEPFLTGGKGKFMYSPQELKTRVKTAHDAGHSVAVHAIGDRATDLVLDAFEATGEPERHRIEHAMILSDEQIERIAKLGVSISMQPEFRLRFLHSYRRQLGDERATRLLRFRSVLDAGIPLGFSSDSPIVPGDPWDGIRMATEHPTEAITFEEAVDAYTRGAAGLDGDELFGRLDIAQFADFQIYEHDPRSGGRPDKMFFAGR